MSNPKIHQYRMALLAIIYLDQTKESKNMWSIHSIRINKWVKLNPWSRNMNRKRMPEKVNKDLCLARTSSCLGRKVPKIRDYLKNKVNKHTGWGILSSLLRQCTHGWAKKHDQSKTRSSNFTIKLSTFSWLSKKSNRLITTFFTLSISSRGCYSRLSETVRCWLRS